MLFTHIEVKHTRGFYVPLLLDGPLRFDDPHLFDCLSLIDLHHCEIKAATVQDDCRPSLLPPKANFVCLIEVKSVLEETNSGNER